MKSDIAQYIEQRDWGAVFASLSLLEKKIVVGFARTDRARFSGIAMCILANDRSVATIGLNLVKEGLLNVARESDSGALYSVADEDFRAYCQKVDKSALWADVSNDIANEFYQLFARRFEALEHLGLIGGNGHHMAQKASAEIKAEIESRWIGGKK